MPTLNDNLNFWGNYDWSQNGDEWSEPFGGTDALWDTVIYPRIKEFLPTDNILEIAVGHGRMTSYLIRYTKHLWGIDILPSCVDYCKKRFNKCDTAYFGLTNGRNITLSDNSINFAFSWDSLVHVDEDVIFSYLEELRRVLTPGGTAFLHHSNAGALSDYNGHHLRDTTVSADLFLKYCLDLGLSCKQEIIDWQDMPKLDCLSIIKKGIG
jgi:ubiquinone/menaquinone biosynthesis C-methylase UbiE